MFLDYSPPHAIGRPAADRVLRRPGFTDHNLGLASQALTFRASGTSRLKVRVHNRAHLFRSLGNITHRRLMRTETGIGFSIGLPQNPPLVVQKAASMKSQMMSRKCQYWAAKSTGQCRS